jgi:predicted RNA binding protein YcfA (HicA-like mRNA interferase family)
MSRHKKTLQKILSGLADKNISFAELRQILLHLGFEERTSGSHHIFRRAGIEEKINIQKDGNKAKPYQVRQVRVIILEYMLGDE